MMNKQLKSGDLCICETTAAYVTHLRKLSSAGPKTGGGADTLTLCGSKPSWDIPSMPITVKTVTCKDCRKFIITFDQWMMKLDTMLLKKFGLTTSDLPDCCYRDWFDDGMSFEHAVNLLQLRM